MVRYRKPVKLSDNIIDRRNEAKSAQKVGAEAERLLQAMLARRISTRGAPNLRPRNKIP